MKKKVFYVMALCMGLFSSCDKDDIGFEEPIVPPIEEPEKPSGPEKPSVIPSTENLIKVKIDDDIMAIVGTETWKSIVYGNGKYVAVSSEIYSYINSHITTSVDGINWSAPKEISRPLGNFISYANGKYWIGGGTVDGKSILNMSDDGENWTNIILSSGSYNQATTKVAYGNGLYVVGSWNGVFVADATKMNWKLIKIADVHNDIVDVAYGNGIFVCVNVNGAIASSSDGENWEVVETGIGFKSVIYANNMFVIGGARISINGIYSPNIRYSTDGINWEVAKGYDNGSIKYLGQVDLTYDNNNGLFVGIMPQYRVSGSVPIYNKKNYVMVSSDGINWSAATELIDEDGNSITNELNDVCSVIN